MKPKTETTAAPLAVIGVDIGKDVFHLVGFGADGKIAFRRKIRRLASQRRVREAAAVHRRHGSLPERALRQQDAARAGTRAADHPGDLRQAVREGAEERLQRCRGHRRSGVATEPALRPGEEPGSARPAGLSSRPVPTGLPPDGDDQPDPRLSDRARHRRQGRPARPAQLALRDIGEPKGRDFAANGQADPRSL